MASPSLKEYLRKEIASTGYPLEIEVSSFLDKDWIVYNNEPFVDEDEGKTREVDIFAVHKSSLFPYSYFKRRDVFILTTDLVVECKKAMTHAWVFFMRPYPPGQDERGPPDGHTVDFLEAFSQGKQSFLDGIDFPKIHYDRVSKMAYNYHEVKLQKDTKGEGEKSIFEAQSQLWKDLTYESKIAREAMEKDRSARVVYIFFPVIVLDGQLFEASGPSERLQLHESNHIILNFSRRSKALGEEKAFMIDVVTKEYFRQYIAIVTRDIETIRNHFKKKRQHLIDRADSLVENLP